jgi:hypothetical protein
MQNSFLIKNHTSANFEKYANHMKKKSAMIEKFSDSPMDDSQIGSLHRQNTFKLNASPFKKFEYGKVKGRMPAARDGHSGVVLNDQLFVFGGDRHRMPFADTFIFDLKASFD